MVCHSRAGPISCSVSMICSSTANSTTGNGKKDNQLRSLYHVGLLKNDKGYVPRKAGCRAPCRSERQIAAPRSPGPFVLLHELRQLPRRCRRRQLVDEHGHQCQTRRYEMIGVKPLHLFARTNPQALLIKPGEPESSVVFLRMSRRALAKCRR